MGTSGSSTGSPSGTPLVPPWVSDPSIIDDPENTPADSTGDNDEIDQEPNTHVLPSPLAPAARFRGARLNFGNYGKSGDERSLRRGLGHYIRTGYGGTTSATKRFSGTARTASTIFNTLSALATNAPSLAGTTLDPGILEGRTARQIVGAIIASIRPSDGTQDTESSRVATNNAFSDLLNKYPEADLLDLSLEQRLNVMEFFIGYDIFNRVCLDVENTIKNKSPNASVAQQRLKDMKQYIKSEIARVFRDEQATHTQWDSKTVQGFVRDVITKTLKVFEDYL